MLLYEKNIMMLAAQSARATMLVFLTTLNNYGLLYILNLTICTKGTKHVLSKKFFSLNEENDYQFFYCLTSTN